MDEATRPEPARAPVLRAAIADHVPLTLRTARLSLDVKSVAVIALAGLLGASIGLIYLLRSRPAPIDQPAPPVVSARPTASGSATTALSGEELVIDVTGKVRRPGIVRVPAGSRVIDAINAAGGAEPGTDLSTLNLARKLTDGEQIFVGIPPPPGAEVAPVGTQPAGHPSGAVLDLNTATLEQLEQLPGVGPVLAQRIIDYRTQHGGFRSVDQLREVTGIGEQRFAELRDLVRV